MEKDEKGDKGNVRVSNVISARLKSARLLCGLTQVEAASRLGFDNSGGLSKIEAGRERLVGLWVLHRAAQVYEVSADYLLGLTDDWEAEARLPERVASHWLYEAWENARQRDLAALAMLESSIRQIAQRAEGMAATALQADDALARVVALNGDAWLDLRAAASVQRHIGQLASEARRLEAALSKLGLRGKSPHQLVLGVVAVPRQGEQVEQGV